MRFLDKEKDEQVLPKVIISRELLKKNNLSHLSGRLGISPKRMGANFIRVLSMAYKRKQQSNRIGVWLSHKTREFLEEDTVSKLCMYRECT